MQQLQQSDVLLEQLESLYIGLTDQPHYGGLPPAPRFQVPTVLLTASATAASLVLHLDDRRGPRPPNSSHKIPFSRSQLAREIGVEENALPLPSYHCTLRRNTKFLYCATLPEIEMKIILKNDWLIKEIIFVMSSEW